MADLKHQYDEKLQQKEELRKKSDFMEMMLDRASQLVSGLIGEKERWENTVTVRRLNPFNAGCSKLLLFKGFSAILV